MGKAVEYHGKSLYLPKTEFFVWKMEAVIIDSHDYRDQEVPLSECRFTLSAVVMASALTD